jgi:hypothetical protein
MTVITSRRFIVVESLEMIRERSGMKEPYSQGPNLKNSKKKSIA